MTADPGQAAAGVDGELVLGEIPERSLDFTFDQFLTDFRKIRPPQIAYEVSVSISWTQRSTGIVFVKRETNVCIWRRQEKPPQDSPASNERACRERRPRHQYLRLRRLHLDKGRHQAAPGEERKEATTPGWFRKGRRGTPQESSRCRRRGQPQEAQQGKVERV